MSSTGGDIAQTYALLQKMYELMNQIEVQGKKTETQTNKNITSMRNLELVALRYLAITRRLGLPEDVEASINNIARLIVLLRQAQMSLNLFYASLIPGAGIVAQLGGVAALTLTGLTTVDTLGSFL